MKIEYAMPYTSLHIDIEYSRTATVHGEIAEVHGKTFDEAVSSSTAQTMAILSNGCASSCFAAHHNSPVCIHCFS